jgi:hypothetical protein
MKRLSLSIVIVLVSLVGLVWDSHAASPVDQAILTQLQSIQNQLTALQGTVALIQTSVNNQSSAIGTLQDSVNNMLPAWYQILPSAERFLMVMGDQAVLDRETGLVWELLPSTAEYVWQEAKNYCNTLTLGNRKGWRLPTIQELASLVYVDTPQPIPALPSGHPFQNVQSSPTSYYWSATTAADTLLTWRVNFYYVNVGIGPKDEHRLVWCVRGGQGVDPQ